MNEKELDKIIKASLTKEEAAYYERLHDQHIVDKVLMLYKGKLSWISLVQTIVMVVTFVIAVYCIIQFYNEADILSALRWGFGAILLLITGCMIKIYLNNVIVEKSVRRDIKRLELQLSHMVSEIKKSQ